MSKNILLGILILWLISNKNLNSQDLFPKNGFFYNDDVVSRVDITISQSDLQELLLPGNEQNNVEYPVTFKFKHGSDSIIFENVGFRLRGNTSRNAQKKSFKVSLNSFDKNLKFLDIEKLNLNGEHNDPSISRAKISWDLFRQMGVAAPRSNHVELYINGVYKGLYLNVEHIDEEFVQTRFGNNQGNFYKCLWPADLSYQGSNQNSYKFIEQGRRPYDLIQNENLDDYADLVQLITLLNNSDPSQFPEILEPVFNVNSYLKSMALEILIGHWDDYSFNKNNFYLYHNTETGKFEYIPYDTDNTFGIDWFGIDWSKRNIYSWYNTNESRPLTKQLLENSIYKDRFSFYMNRFLKERFNRDSLQSELYTLRDKLTPFVTKDLFRELDYGFSFSDYYSSFESLSYAHVKMGILSYIDNRSSSANNQLVINNISPVISLVHVNKPDLLEDIKIKALVEDEDTLVSVTLFYTSNDVTQSAPMLLAEDETYRVVLPGKSARGYMNYYIEATDEQLNITREPVTGYFTVGIGNPTGVESNFASQPGFKIIPNPIQSEFDIWGLSTNSKTEYSIYELSGKLITKGASNESAINLSKAQLNLKSGIYLISIFGKNNHGEIVQQSHEKLIVL